jgi:hypothetical protein
VFFLSAAARPTWPGLLTLLATLFLTATAPGLLQAQTPDVAGASGTGDFREVVITNTGDNSDTVSQLQGTAPLQVVSQTPGIDFVTTGQNTYDWGIWADDNALRVQLSPNNELLKITRDGDLELNGESLTSIIDARINALVSQHIQQNCKIGIGWRDNCDNCEIAPAREAWVNVGDVSQCTALGWETRCIMSGPGAMATLGTSGDVDGYDHFYVGFTCS